VFRFTLAVHYMLCQMHPHITGALVQAEGHLADCKAELCNNCSDLALWLYFFTQLQRTYVLLHCCHSGPETFCLTCP